jgi:GNAT superfamily N-acetyltransferase
MGAAVIRIVEKADFDSWHRLWQGYLDFYRAELSEETTIKTFERLVNQTDGLVGLVAPGDDSESDNPELLGFAHLVFHPSTWSTKLYCYLEDLFVSPGARGRSTARELILATYAEADRRGAAQTYWQTQQFNGAARSLYDQVAHPTSFVVYQR